MAISLVGKGREIYPSLVFISKLMIDFHIKGVALGADSVIKVDDGGQVPGEIQADAASELPVFEASLADAIEDSAGVQKWL